MSFSGEIIAVRTFFSETDYRFYLNILHEASQRYGLVIHAYILMTNHVHLLVTPSNEIALPKVMQSIGRCYVQHINKTYKRTGTLWEGRYKSSLIQADEYLFHCYRYIEMNPVSAGMVNFPGEYAWSSYHHNGSGRKDVLINEHDLYTQLGSTCDERQESYRGLFNTALDKSVVDSIQNAAHFSAPLGNAVFSRGN